MLLEEKMVLEKGGAEVEVEVWNSSISDHRSDVQTQEFVSYFPEVQIYRPPSLSGAVGRKLEA